MLSVCVPCVLFLQFPDETLRSGELLNMIVAVIDSTQVVFWGGFLALSSVFQLTQLYHILTVFQRARVYSFRS